MTHQFFRFLILSLALVVLSSCLWDEEEDAIPSSNPTFVSLTFGANDSVPALQYATFTLEYDSLLNDSIIVNLDSLPFQTRIDSVFPSFAFKSTSAAFLLLTDSLGTGIDTIAVTGNDTIDFTKVIAIRNIAGDKIVERTYPIKVNVHQVEPELYHWNYLVTDVYTHPASVQKAVYFNDKFFFYASSGVNNYLYSSTDAVSWSAAALSGLPLYPDLRRMMHFDDELYFLHEDGVIYHSTDGNSWQTLAAALPGHRFTALLFVLENQLWSVVQNTATEAHYFARSIDGLTWTVAEALPASFPVSDFAAVSFKSRTNKPKALVVGGFAADGTLLSKSWSVEYNVNSQYNWVDFSLENNTLDTLSGASIIAYADKLLLFGGMDNDNNVLDNFYMESIDEGLSWRATDSTYNTITDYDLEYSYEPRSYQSVVLRDDVHEIYLFGGRTKFEVFTDVWRGKLNKLSFLRQ